MLWSSGRDFTVVKPSSWYRARAGLVGSTFKEMRSKLASAAVRAASRNSARPTPRPRQTHTTPTVSSGTPTPAKP